MNFEDYHAIVNLLGRYGMILDAASLGECSWDRLGEIFTEDSVFDMSPLDAGVLNGLDAITRAMEVGTQPWAHHMTNPVVVSTGPDSAVCDTKGISALSDGRMCTGTYHDQVVRLENGEWRIRSRVVTMRPLDADAPQPIFARP